MKVKGAKLRRSIHSLPYIYICGREIGGPFALRFFLASGNFKGLKNAFSVFTASKICNWTLANGIPWVTALLFNIFI